jgi:hypothetical protein
VTREQHREIKKEIVKLAREHDLVFCAYAILHDIAKGETHDNLVQFGANTLLGKFNQFLGDSSDVGLVLFDRLPIKNAYQYLKEKFQAGLQVDKETLKLENVVGFASTCDGASHLASVADILLGSFRYCVNEPDKDIANSAIFPTLVRVMWYREDNETKNLAEYGLTLRPQEIKVDAYKKEYDELIKRLLGYLDQEETE